jgi:hypothetical protein
MKYGTEIFRTKIEFRIGLDCTCTRKNPLKKSIRHLLVKSKISTASHWHTFINRYYKIVPIDLSNDENVKMTVVNGNKRQQNQHLTLFWIKTTTLLGKFLGIRDSFEHICFIFTRTNSLTLLRRNPSSTECKKVQSRAINFGRQGHSLTQSKMLHCKTVVNIITYHHVVWH